MPPTASFCEQKRSKTAGAGDVNVSLIMNIIKSIAQLRKILDNEHKKGNTIGFVPTMGYFHEGHLSLMRRARKETDVVVVSIFVNPIQFGPREDYRRYPRNMRRDTALARQEKVDYIFYPSVKTMYQSPYHTFVNVEKITDILCGLCRPGHFKGVTTVVCKLFHIVQPDIAYFGQKDYQQYVVIKRMVDELHMPVKIKMCPIIREYDGLAMSSRNVYLTPEERERALTLYKSLCMARRLVRAGERNPQKVITEMKKLLEKNVNRIDYIAILNPEGFESVERLKGKLFIGVAAYVGRTRLIDNTIINV